VEASLLSWNRQTTVVPRHRLGGYLIEITRDRYDDRIGADDVKNILKKATTHQELSEKEIFGLISAINRDEVSEVQIAGFQVALLMKGSSLKEITHLAKAMRENCIPLRPHVQEELMDTCGTGGGLSTFNISTATAVVAAAAGIPIAKHGSRSISSLSGSADVLEALAIGLEPLVEAHTREELGWAGGIGARLVGINNRNILELEKDDGTVSATQLLAEYKPENALLISESSIQTPLEGQAAIRAGADVLLIGTALWQAEDMAASYQAFSRGIGNHR